MTTGDILDMQAMFDEAEELYNNGDYLNAYFLYTECEEWFNKDGSGQGDAEIILHEMINHMLNTIQLRCQSLLVAQQSYHYNLTKSKYIK